MTMLIFDCDGVLVDSESLLINAELEFLARFGHEFERVEYIQRFTGTSLASWEKAISELVANSSGKPPSAEDFRLLAADTDQALKASLTEVRGAHRYLSKLTCMSCVASSSTPSQLGWKLRVTGLDKFFMDRVFSATQVSRGKPAPDLFLYAASQMQVDPSECIVIEDSSSGIKAAKTAGMVAIGLVAASHCPSGFEAVLMRDGADFVANSYAELADWVGARLPDTNV